MPSTTELKQLRARGVPEDEIARILAGEKGVQTPPPLPITRQANVFDGPYASHAEFQELGKQNLQNRGWWVGEIFKGTHKGGGVRYTKGLPDTVAVKDGRHVWVEYKMPGDGPSEAQLDTQRGLLLAGAEVLTVWTLRQLLEGIGEG